MPISRPPNFIATLTLFN